MGRPVKWSRDLHLMEEAQIELALEDDYLSRDPSPSKRAAYIRRTMEKARRWAER